MIENVSDLVQDLEHSVWSDQPHDAHIRYLFRGQPKPDLPLAPKVYRPSFVPAGATESERCQKECNLYQDFKVMSASLRSGRETEVELYFLQQHYGMPTRLLDWTNNPLAALYFACSGDWSYDGKIFLMDAYELPQPVKNKRGVATSTDMAIGLAVAAVVRGEEAGTRRAAGRIVAVRPDYFDRRISLQRGSFTLHGPEHRIITTKDNPTLRSLKISAERKQRILQQLTLLGMDHFSIFGDLENLARRLNRSQ